MEEGEVAPDAGHKTRPSAVEHRKRAESSHGKEKGRERGKVKKVESVVSLDLGTQCKGLTGASHSVDAGIQEGKRRDGLVAEAGKATDKGCEKSSLKVEEEGEGKHGLQSQNVVASDANQQNRLSTSPIHQQEVLQERVEPHEEATNSVNAVEQSASSSILKEVIQEETTTQSESTHDVDVIERSVSSRLRQGATQEEATVLPKTSCALDEFEKNTSPIVRQEHLLVLNGTGIDVDEVGKSVSSNMVEEVRQEEVMQLGGTASAVDRFVDEVGKRNSFDRVQEVLQEEEMQLDGTANAVDRVEIGSSGMLQEAMQEKIPIPDEITNTVGNLEPMSHSSLIREAVHDEEDGMASTTDVVGQFNSSDMAKDPMHEIAIAFGVTDAADVAEESNVSTGPPREVVPCLHQQALESKELENLIVVEEKISEPRECVASRPVEGEHCGKRGAPMETTLAEGVVVMHENVEKRVKIFDVEVKTESTNVFLQPTKEHAEGRKEEATNVNVMTRNRMDEDKGNGIGIAFDVLSKKDNIDLVETVGRGIDSKLQLRTEPTEIPKSALTTSIKEEHEGIKVGKLDLSLSLSGCVHNSESKSSTSKTGSLVHAPRSQLLPSSSFRTNSDGFTASMSQALEHNPICSLRQQPLDNYEDSVGSKPLFAGVDQMGNCAGWQAQLSSESTQKGGGSAQLQRGQQNVPVPDTLVSISGYNTGMSRDLGRLASIPGVSSAGSPDPLHHSRFRRQLTGERSKSLTRGEDERREGEQIIINGSGVVEMVIFKVVSEPFHHTARMLQEMTENSIRYLREAISDIIVDPDKRGQIIALQEALKKRSDLNSDMLRTCPQLLMEILVAIRTGLPHFIKKSSSVALYDLVDIFLNLKCCNISCRSVLPVDGCDCKICQRRTGFCSSCMCIVCLNFDLASNTCSWVGCDVCLHWCHTDCGLRHSLIQKGRNSARANTKEMQFHCAACGHPSEMFGFVKEVFRACARQWRMDTLARELRYVERIFSCSDDARGKRVWDFVKQMLIKLENKAYYPEVVKCVVTFFSDDDAHSTGPSEPLRGIPCSIDEGVDGIPSSTRMAAWKPYTLEGLPVLEKEIVHYTTGSPSLHRKSVEAELHADDNKPVIDKLDILVRLKKAEANMYQEHANDARSQADDLRHIVMVKTARIEEDYATRIADLNINELQERRKQKIEELQVFERAHRQFFNMKTRMEASIRELLLKMETMKQN